MKTRLFYFLNFAFLLLFARSLYAQWSDFGTGANDAIYDFIQLDDDLIAAGRFSTFDGSSNQGLAIWRKDFNDVWVWDELANAGWVYDLEIYDGELYVCGSIGYINSSLPVGCIAKYSKGETNGWSAVGNGGIGGYNFTADVWSMAVYNGKLYAGGTFTSIGGVTARNIAVWDGTIWSQVGGGLQSSLYNGARKLFVYNGELYASGSFTQAGSVQVSGIAKWDESNWSAVVDFGMNGSSVGRVNAFAEYNGSLFAAGNFTTVNGAPSDGIAMYDGNTWFDVSIGVPSGGNITGLGIYKGDLYASGSFGSTGKIMKWDPNTSVWTGFASLTGGSAYALFEYNGSMIAGGTFTTVESTPYFRIASYPKLDPVGLASYQNDDPD
ncbi:MAG: hypothetical protein JNL60_13625, partial [Bacteroidia bacterium]|nr:hypothetical protein [Bacteroidia bacterium]